MGPAATLNVLPRRAAPAQTSRTPIDHAHLARYTFGNAELEREVLGLFAAQAPQTMDWLRTATTPKAWRDAAHTLKGSARAVGATQVAAAAEQAEQLAHTPDADARRRAIADLERALDVACTYIDALPVTG